MSPRTAGWFDSLHRDWAPGLLRLDSPARDARKGSVSVLDHGAFLEPGPGLHLGRWPLSPAPLARLGISPPGKGRASPEFSASPSHSLASQSLPLGPASLLGFELCHCLRHLEQTQALGT